MVCRAKKAEELYYESCEIVEISMISVKLAAEIASSSLNLRTGTW